MSTIIGLVSTFRLPLQRVADWTLKWSEAWMKSKIGMYACKNGLYDA